MKLINAEIYNELEKLRDYVYDIVKIDFSYTDKDIKEVYRDAVQYAYKTLDEILWKLNPVEDD